MGIPGASIVNEREGLRIGGGVYGGVAPSLSLSRSITGVDCDCGIVMFFGRFRPFSSNSESGSSAL